ncbi:MAG TPA: hypothetical protein VFF11_06535 [Candidatus Binatia bacterium]|nr:hypothetical protein [Candidatus Binatia bacterium]
MTRFGILSLNCLPAILLLLFGIARADAAAITIDGNVTPLTIVSNAIFQTDDLVLANGASLVAESNAVIGSVNSLLATPGSTVTMNPGSYVGQINGQGASVIVNGGICGNFGLSQSSIIIYGMDSMPDGSSVSLSLGFSAEGDAITINGGKYSGVFSVLQDSDLTINGGDFGPGFIAVVNAPQGTNQVVINGGAFGGGDVESDIISYGPLFIHGGTFENSIRFSDTLYVDGGTFGGPVAGSGVLYLDYFGADYTPEVYIAGGSFNGSNSGYFSNEAYPYNWNVVVHGTALDESAYDSATGGILGATFCSKATTAIGFANSPYGQPPAITLDPCSEDSDGDGVPDNVDHCIFSDLNPTVKIGDCDSGVSNEINGSLVNADGCSLADLIDAELVKAATGAKNHGQYVKTMAAYFNGLLKQGVIGSSDKDALMSCVGASDEHQFVQ